MGAALSTRKAGDVAVVCPAGRIVLGPPAESLRQTLRELVNAGEKKILLNLSDVFYMDSAGIGALVSAWSTAARNGCALRLVGLNKRVRDLLRVTNLEGVFDIHDEEAHALRTFV